jgi:hypothetical protein
MQEQVTWLPGEQRTQEPIWVARSMVRLWPSRVSVPMVTKDRSSVWCHGGATSYLSREQKGRFIATCWTAQVYKHIPDPKPAYVADWPDLPDWQQQADADIFEHIERDGAGSPAN